MTTAPEVRAELRKRLHGGAQRTYWLVELEDATAPVREAFLAPSDAVALERALDVVEGDVFEVWEGERLVRRWTSAENDGRSFAPR